MLKLFRDGSLGGSFCLGCAALGYIAVDYAYRQYIRSGHTLVKIAYFGIAIPSLILITLLILSVANALVIWIFHIISTLMEKSSM
jgi:hypothetical protein